MSAKLYYVIGPSGAGKDSIMNWVRAQLNPSVHRVVFAHRYITRPADPNSEVFISLSEPEFRLRQEAGCFLFHWESHGLCYGIGREVLDWMERGLTVIMNGSRGYLSEASERMPDLIPLLIMVDPSVLRRRLEGRGREDAQSIEARLERAGVFQVEHPKLVTIANNGPLEEAGQAILALLR